MDFTRLVECLYVLLSFILLFLINTYSVFGIYIILFGVACNYFSVYGQHFPFFFSTARGSVLKPEPDTIHKDISGMKIHSYVHCLLLTHFILEIYSTLVTLS